MLPPFLRRNPQSGGKAQLMAASIGDAASGSAHRGRGQAIDVPAGFSVFKTVISIVVSIVIAVSLFIVLTVTRLSVQGSGEKQKLPCPLDKTASARGPAV